MFDILLVEDERWVRTALRKTIERTGLPFRVIHETTNGVEAVDWLNDHAASIVLTDIRMPVMDGLALMEEIRRRNNDTAVVIISGHDDFSYAQRALQLGAFDYLLKPVEADNMTVCLQKWLDHQEKEPSMAPEVHPFDVKEMSPIEQVTRYIDAMLIPEMTLTEAAAMVHLNPSYFCKLFKQHTKVKFTDYMTKVRMKEATRLLEKTSLRISEIAERLGYADLAYFSNTFKKTMGLTPSDYRKNKE
ncbi:MAG: response regulator [Paenibacillaceae bacterium]